MKNVLALPPMVRALAWEQLRTSRMWILATFVAMLGLPVIHHLFTQAFLPETRAANAAGLQSFVNFYLISFIGAFWVALSPAETKGGLVARLFVLPAPTWLLASVRLVLTMAVSCATYLVAVVIVNQSLGLEWPVLEPALALATGAAWMVVFFSTAKTARLTEFAAFAVVLAILAAWIISHVSRTPETLAGVVWRAFSSTDLLVAALFNAGAFFAAIIGTARARCGESHAIQLDVWWDRQLQRLWVKRPRIKNRRDAQLFLLTRFDWVGPAMIVAYFAAIGVASVFGAIGLKDTAELAVLGALSWPVLCSTLIGMLVSLPLQPTGALPMRSVVATKPVADIELANTLLHAALRMAIKTWCWATCCGLLVALVFALAGRADLVFSQFANSLNLPPLVQDFAALLRAAAFSLAFSCLLSALSTCFGSRRRHFVWLVAGSFVLAFATILAMSVSVSASWFDAAAFIADTVLPVFVGVAAAAYVGWQCWAAYRLGLVHRNYLAAAVLLSAAIAVANDVYLPHQFAPLVQFIYWTGLASLLFLPIPGVRLAVAESRHV